jgi:hypothetical protein
VTRSSREVVDVADSDAQQAGSPAGPGSNPFVPEADAAEQAEDVTPPPARPTPPRNPEVPEADALEQSIEAPYDDEFGGSPET